MKHKKLLLAAFAAMTLQGMFAQQPYGGCWHPEDIKNWSPETDKDAKFNRAKVPLAKRFKEPTLMKANAYQWYEGQVCNATILFNMCSLCPSQGAYNFVGYQPTYWQYMDKVVHWAGAASEGIIIPPPAGSIDAAHQSGVKALGQIFFPPKIFGGQDIWEQQMMTKEDGEYIYARKLYEIAKYLGFDGWFINEETYTYDAESFQPFIADFYRIAHEDGNNDMEIQWYRATSTPNIDILKTDVNTSQFLEYGAVGDYRSYAKQLDCTEEQTFSKLFAGVQCVSSGLTGYGTELRAAMPKDGHVGSVDLFCPEEHAWKDNVKDLLGTKDDCGEKAYEAVIQTFKNENMAWTNNDGDPSTGGSTTWPGLSGAVLERSVINAMPFTTSFCVGVGKHRFVDGEKQATQDWYHSGVQSIMPTWRYWIENKGSLSVSIDWDDAYNFGSSLKIAGALSAGNHLMRLYKTMIPVTAGGKLRLVYKTSTPGSIEVKLSTESSTTPDVTLVNSSITEKNGWTVAEYDLASLNGKTLYMIALNLKADAEVAAYTLQLGQLSVLADGYAPAVVSVNNLSSTSALGDEGGDIRATWDYTYTSDFDHFDVYTVTEDNQRKMVGQTRDEAFYIPSFKRNGFDKNVTVEVVPVMKDMKQGKGQSIKVAYPAPKVPEVTLSLSKSYIKVGEKTTITAKGTGNPTAWKWTLPATLKLVEESNLTDDHIVVEGLKEGEQTLTVEATNAIGTSKTEVYALDVLSDGMYNTVENVVAHKKVVDYSGSTNSTEVPNKIIDGVQTPSSTNQKWCNISPDNWVVFDMFSLYKVYGFRIFDCKSGPENDENIKSYEIQLSTDGTNWTNVVTRTDCEDEDIKTDYIAPFKARYVRFSPHVAGTLRVWEFEVFGADLSNMTLSVDKDMMLEPSSEGTLKVKYALNGDKRADEFTCTVENLDKEENRIITLGTPVEDKVNSEFYIPVSAASQLGSDRVKVVVYNGEMMREITFSIDVYKADQPNVLLGRMASLRKYKSDWGRNKKYYEFTDQTGLTDGDKTAEACSAIETPSTYEDDVWAVMKADNKWNISKVKVYIPSNNKGVNDNDVKGIVNNRIKIALSNDGTSWDFVKTFDNLGEVSELEYLLPESQSCRYIGIACNVNAYFYGSLAEVEAYEQLPAPVIPTKAVDVKSGWNKDMIAERAAGDAYTGAVDGSSPFYTTSVAEKGAIAGDDHVVVSNSGVKYELAAYDADNALYLTSGESATIELAEAVKTNKLYFLCAASRDNTELNITAQYADNTQSETLKCVITSWESYGETGKEAVYGLYGLSEWNDYQPVDFYDYSLYEYALTVDPTKEITSLSLNCSNRKATLLAISQNDIAASGINPINGASACQPVKVFTIDGRQVQTLQRGINIVKMADGTTKKILVK